MKILLFLCKCDMPLNLCLFYLYHPTNNKLFHSAPFLSTSVSVLSLNMMLGIEDILCEIPDEEQHGHGGFPPGFRFHPTDEELITFFLVSKVFHGSTLCPLDIAEVDLNKCEPWDIPDVAQMGKREWYFYSLRDRKYPIGLRTNRATATGYWKATGKDKEIHNAATGAVIGMKKTLVFYLGRAPRGQKTKWVMHEYRLHGHYSSRAAAAKEEWVICRICRKPSEKTAMLLNETDSHFEPVSSIARKESFLPQLIDSQWSDQFLKNQTSVFPIEYESNEDNNRASQMYNNPLQAGPLASYSFQPATYYPATDISMNPCASFSSKLIRSLLSSEDPNNNLKQANNFTPELVKTETNFPHLLPGGGDLEWTNGFLRNNHLNLDANANVIDQVPAAVELSGGGCLQMVVNPNFRIPTGECRALDA